MTAADSFFDEVTTNQTAEIERLDKKTPTNFTTRNKRGEKKNEIPLIFLDFSKLEISREAFEAQHEEIVEVGRTRLAHNPHAVTAAHQLARAAGWMLP